MCGEHGGNLAPRDIASRAAREQIDGGHGVGPLRTSVYLDFRDAMARHGRDVIADRYGNLFTLYRDATGEDPWTVPMRIAPGAHFAMGGLWTDYDQQTTIPGLFVGGEASSNYHGANRLGANSLLSASVDGWFTLPITVPDYLADHLGGVLPDQTDPAVTATVDDVRAGIDRLCAVGGSRPTSMFHRRLGELMYRHCGVTRSEQGLLEGIEAVRALREEFWSDLRVVGTPEEFNQDLERAGRVADYFELADLMLIDALDRDESCGAHFRVEHQTKTSRSGGNRRSRSTRTAERASVAPVASWWTATPTGPGPTPPRVTSTCGTSPTATSSRSSRCGWAPSRSCATWSWTAARSTAC